MARRVLLVCWGSRGDVAPLITLGRGMQTAGDEVSMLAPRDFADLVTSAGLGFLPFEIDLYATADSPEGRSWLGGHRTLVGEGVALQRMLDQFAGPLIEGLWEHTGDADLLVSGVLTVDACASLAQASGQAHAMAVLAPLLPSRHGPSSVSAVLPRRSSYANLLVSQAMLASAYRLIKVPGAQIRRSLGHRRTGPRWFAQQLRATPTVLGASRYVVPPAPDQPQITTTGYWPPWGGVGGVGQPIGPEAASAQRIETDVAKAHSRGRPVVYLGFGSMTTRDAAGTARLLVRASHQAGVHPIVHSGWSGIARHLRELGAQYDLDMTIVDQVPHDWLFARCDAVVHHGGAGTTGSAARAGVPQVVVPHMGDQPYWAARMHHLGVAGPGLRRAGLTPKRLSEATVEATSGASAERRRLAARRLTALVDTEDGVATAVAALSASG